MVFGSCWDHACGQILVLMLEKSWSVFRITGFGSGRILGVGGGFFTIHWWRGEISTREGRWDLGPVSERQIWHFWGGKFDFDSQCRGSLAKTLGLKSAKKSKSQEANIKSLGRMAGFSVLGSKKTQQSPLNS